MKHLFNSELLKGLWVLIIVFFAVKLVWFLLEVMWLPTSGIDHIEKKGSKALYYRVKLSPNKAPAPTVKKKPIIATKGTIKDIKLLAIYNASDTTVITVSYKSKTKVLSKGEAINGFVLEGAGNNYATFSKNAETYKITLMVSKKSKATMQSIKPVPSPLKSTEKDKVEGSVVDAGDHKIIDKSLLEHYSKNMDDIYKNIGITEVKNGKILEAFKISFIRKGSPFAKLGVKKGDVIKSINGQKIDSYNAAFGVYKNIQNINNLTLVIQRGKEEMELEYEVN